MVGIWGSREVYIWQTSCKGKADRGDLGIQRDWKQFEVIHILEKHKEHLQVLVMAAHTFNPALRQR